MFKVLLNFIGLSLVLSCQLYGQLDATKYLPQGYSKLGDVDYTSHLQKAIDENKKLKLPNFPVLINNKGLKIRSGSELYFQDSSMLILKKSLTRSYNILDIENVQNVSIYSPKIRGERYPKIDGKIRTGEWGMCIAIRSSENVNIYNAELYDAWGDGIYLGKSNKNRNKTNRNIHIEGAKIFNARRNGISITTVDKLVLLNTYIEGVTGVSPKAAIDIEPNGSYDVIREIEISNLVTKNNGYGMLISLRRLISQNPHEVSILLENHSDDGSIQAFRYAGFNNVSTLNNLVPLKGEIIVRNSRWTNNKGSFTYEDGRGLFPELKFYGIIRHHNKRNIIEKNPTYHNSLKYITKYQSNIKFFEGNK